MAKHATTAAIVALALGIFANAAVADSLRFTETQMPLGTTSSVVPLTGNEYLAFGITVQNVYRYYDSRDPFSDGAENFSGSSPFGLASYPIGASIIARIDFTHPVSNLEIDWWTISGTLFLDVYSTDNVLLFSTSGVSTGGTTSIINQSNIGYFTFHNTGGFVAVSNIRFSSDSDGDGVPDFDDACPLSDLSPTVVIDSCNSGVPNTLLSSGCTISDQVAKCADAVSNHGEFVSCVAHLTNDLGKAGIITGEQKGTIQRCAAQANIP